MKDLCDVQPVRKRVMGFEGNSWEEVRGYKKEWSLCHCTPVFPEPQE